MNVTDLVTVDKDDLGEPAGAVPGYLLEEVDRGLRRVLDLMTDHPPRRRRAPDSGRGVPTLFPRTMPRIPRSSGPTLTEPAGQQPPPSPGSKGASSRGTAKPQVRRLFWGHAARRATARGTLGAQELRPRVRRGARQRRQGRHRTGPGRHPESSRRRRVTSSPTGGAGGGAAPEEPRHRNHAGTCACVGIAEHQVPVHVGHRPGHGQPDACCAAGGRHMFA